VTPAYDFETRGRNFLPGIVIAVRAPVRLYGPANQPGRQAGRPPLIKLFANAIKAG
jgi:hypothetical protein